MVCEVYTTTNLLGKKWTIALLEAISQNGHLGFNYLAKHVGSITPRVLANRIAELEEQKLIEKKYVHDANFKRSSYRITPKGNELLHILLLVRNWSIKFNDNLPCERGQCKECPRESWLSAP